MELPGFRDYPPPNTRVLVVEVSTAYNLHGLIQKVCQKEFQWIDQLKAQLETSGVTDSEWSYGVKVFARQDRLEWFKNAINAVSGVTVCDIERTLSRWSPGWGDEP